MVSQTTTWMSLVVVVMAAAGLNAGNVEDDRQVKKTEEVKADRETNVQEEGQSYRAKSVLGSKVMIEGEVSIGTVDDIVFSDDGYVEYLIVSNKIS